MGVRVVLQRMGAVGLHEVIEAASKVEEAFPIDVRVDIVTWSLPPPLHAFNVERMQYEAEAAALSLYEHYRRLIGQDNVLVVGIVNGDGYVDGFNFVFGLAIPRLRTAVVFTKRLEGSRRVFIERLAKEITHEVGHLLGLGHCSNPACVMSFSNTLEEVDRKKLGFCDSCARVLMERYGARSGSWRL
ncbi:archaemetzincin family Zn-dependent metalloprotease [Stetteria hydrogenophila]